MGFITKAIKTIFSPSVPQVDYSSTVTGRDLLSESTSEEPEAPVMGSDSKKRQRNNGVNSLLVQTEDLYKGGIS